MASLCLEVTGLEPSQQLRLFLALPVPDEVKTALVSAQRQFQNAIQDQLVRWSKREQFHVTLRFFGNVPTEQVGEVSRALEHACEPFHVIPLRAAQIGFFPSPRAPRVMWAGLSDEREDLHRLWESISRATSSFAEKPEDKFSAHVTLARMQHLPKKEVERLANIALGFRDTVFGEWTASHLELMRSELSPQGARHTILTTFQLSP